MSKVVIYSSDFCPFCHRAKSLLSKKGASFKEINIDGEPKARSKMMELSGQRTVPQIWIGETHVGGCDDLYALERSGSLSALLA